MLTNREELDRLFHDKLSDFSPNPPQYLWDNIELHLNSKKRSSYPLKMFGVAAAVLILIFTGWWIHPFTSHNAYLITQNSARMENNAHPLQKTPEKKEIPEQNKLDRDD
jgi:hypothetical protein